MAAMLFACGDHDAATSSDDHNHNQPQCGGHGELHEDHCHCDRGYEVDADDEKLCVPAENGDHADAGDTHHDHHHSDAGDTHHDHQHADAGDTHDDHQHADAGDTHDNHQHSDAGDTHDEHQHADAGDTHDSGSHAAECGGHGHLHGDHCHCDDGYEPSPSNERTCIASTAPTGERLVVADPTAKRLYVFALGTWELVADFEDVEVNDHAGFLALDDGRLVFHDSAAGKLRIASIAGLEEPSLGDAVEVRGQVAHLATDPDQRYLSASAALESGEHGAFTLVSIDDLLTNEVMLPAGEPGIALGGDPLMLFHRNDSPAQFEMYPIVDLLEGSLSATDTVAIGTGPHGEVIAHSRGKIVSAADDGVNIVPFTASGFGEVVKVPYDIDGRSGGRAFYARLSGDGRYLYSYLRESGPEGTAWGEWRNDAYIVDLKDDTARRMKVGDGLVYRLGACDTLAAFTQYHPDGDYVHLLDADSDSNSFQQFVAKVPLEAMSQTPEPDADVWSSVAFRSTAMSTDCRYAFVTHGGDGRVSVVDTTAQKVVHTLEVPTSLDYGGYLVSVQSGVAQVDTIAR